MRLFKGNIKLAIHHSKHFLYYTLWVLCDITNSQVMKCWISPWYAWYAKQLYRALGSERLLFICALMGQSRSKCSNTLFFPFPYFHWKTVCHDFVWYDDYLGRILSNIRVDTCWNNIPLLVYLFVFCFVLFCFCFGCNLYSTLFHCIVRFRKLFVWHVMIHTIYSDL